MVLNVVWELIETPVILKAGPGAVTPRLAQTACGNVMLLKAGPGAVTPRLAQTGCGNVMLPQSWTWCRHTSTSSDGLR